MRRIRSNLMKTLSSALDVAQSALVMIEFARFSRTSGVENADLRFLRASPFFSPLPAAFSLLLPVPVPPKSRNALTLEFHLIPACSVPRLF